MQAAWLVARAAAADALLHLWGARALTTGTASTPANATKLTSQCTRQVLKLLLSNLAALAECARLLSCQ
jgi:hypothetical protein